MCVWTHAQYTCHIPLTSYHAYYCCILILKNEIHSQIYLGWKDCALVSPFLIHCKLQGYLEFRLQVPLENEGEIFPSKSCWAKTIYQANQDPDLPVNILQTIFRAPLRAGRDVAAATVSSIWLDTRKKTSPFYPGMYLSRA